MDSFTLKKSFIWVMLLLLCGMTLKAANNPQVVVKLDKPGSLISKVSFYTTNSQSYWIVGWEGYVLSP